MTFSVVGTMHPNADGGNRLFEVAMCVRGERIHLVPEPENKKDPSAVAVFSDRHIQIGYLSAERCGWVGAKIRLGEDIVAVFQEATKGGALIRIAFSGELPMLPTPRPNPEHEPSIGFNDAFYPDDLPPDD